MAKKKDVQNINEPEIKIPKNVKSREPLLYISVGKKGCGKTYSTVHTVILKYIKGNQSKNLPPRKVLILDVNNEYGQYGFRAMKLQDVELYTYHPRVEVRRVIPFNEDGQKWSINELQEGLKHILDVFRGGLLVVEDPAKFTSTNMNIELIGSLCTQRHLDCDVLMHFQSIGRAATPALKSNMNILRFHKCLDTVERHKNKFEEYTEILKIAENIVNKRYQEHVKNNRTGQTYFPFCVFVDFDRDKIFGEFTKKEFTKALEAYVMENENDTVGRLLKLKDRDTGKSLYNYKTAFDKTEADLFEKYWGN